MAFFAGRILTWFIKNNLSSGIALLFHNKLGPAVFDFDAEI